MDYWSWLLRWLTAQRCYVHFLTKLRFWYRYYLILARAFSHLGTKCEIWIRYNNKEQELSCRKQIARQLRTQYVEGIYDNSVTLKSRLTVTQDHWKRNHWVDHTQLTITRVIGHWIILWPWNMGQRSLRVIEISAIRKLECSFLFAFFSNYGRICSHLWDIQCQRTAWP